METKTIIYKGTKLMCFYTLLPEEKEETETGFSGKDEWKQLERVLVGGVDISNLLEFEWQYIEDELNK